MARKQLDARNPLEGVVREAVVPTPLRPAPAGTPSEDRQQAGVSANQQGGLKHPRSQPRPGDKQYSTYLRISSIKAIKRYAFDRDLPATEILQSAVDEYLRERGAPTDL